MDRGIDRVILRVFRDTDREDFMVHIILTTTTRALENHREVIDTVIIDLKDINLMGMRFRENLSYQDGRSGFRKRGGERDIRDFRDFRGSDGRHKKDLMLMKDKEKYPI